MIEFYGYISGKAEKYYWKRLVTFEQNVLLIPALLISPFPITVALQRKDITMLLCYLLIILSIPFLVRIAKTKKTKDDHKPYRIAIEDGYIVCQTNKETESRSFQDVKQIYDYGEWYSFVFVFGKKTTRFVCQKDLISKGTLKDFEELFKGKIIDRTK